MQTQTHHSQVNQKFSTSFQKEASTPTPTEIQSIVDDRGFYLYEWISSDELRMSLDRDYLTTVRLASIPLAIFTAIAALLGFSGGVIGSILAVIAVLGVFYLLVGVYLFLRFLRRSYLYTRGANVVITDHHFVSGGQIIEQTDQEQIKRKFSTMEEIFDESFLGESRLATKKENEKKLLWENLKEVAQSGGGILKRVGNSRDAGGIVIVIFIAGTLYAAMMGIVYFIGVFFIALLGRLFAWMAHRYLLATSNTEHTIQTLFSRIDEQSRLIKSRKTETVNLLDEARRNEWKDSLLTKINESNEVLAKLASTATDDTRRLREILESSEYQSIFNFSKYGSWVKRQILEPLDSIYLLLGENRDRISETIEEIKKQIEATQEPSLRTPLALQQSRLISQQASFEKIMTMIDGYRERLREKG